MIIPRISPGEFNAVDIRVSAAAPWNDSFFCTMMTRPLPPEWTSVELIIRPAFDHPTLIRKLSSAGDAPEIIVDDADRCGLSIRVAQSVVAGFLRRPDGTTSRYSQLLRFVYPAAIDTFEHWRGALIVEPGLLP